jgi:hypothetical protein
MTDQPTIVLSRTRRIDWSRVIANLQTQGMSLQQIADAVEVSKTLASGLADEDDIREPAFWTGSALIELWCRRTGLRWPDLPVRVVTPSVSQVLRESV